MKKFLTKILLAFVVVVSLTPVCSAAKIEADATVAVMDFGTHSGAVPIDLDVLNAGQAAHEYILQRMFAGGKFSVVDHELVEEKIKTEHLNTTGIIDPDTAKRLGEIVGANYVLYGNVNDVTLSDVGTSLGIAGTTVCTVQSHIIARLMNVATGDIVAMVKGGGKSKSSYVRVKGGQVTLIAVGAQKVTQDSVHNAIQGAAFETVDNLTQMVYEQPAAKQKK